MTTVDVLVQKLDEYGDYLANQVHQDLGQVSLQATGEGTDTAGFDTGLLVPLVAGMAELRRLFSIFFNTVTDRLATTEGALWASATQYEETDRKHADLINQAYPEAR